MRPHGGFALLITITLVAFLVLILVSLAALTRVETQVAANSQSTAQARQNALLALNIALGQLQRHTGPDQRVTATADLQPLTAGTSTDTASGVDLNSAATATLSAIDTYWRDSRNRRWVGAWRNTNNDPADYDSDSPADFNPTPTLQAWLVSGNEATGNDHLPQTQVANFTLAGVTSPAAATATFGTDTSPYRLLVGPGTVLIEDANDIDRAIVVPQVEIKADGIPGLSGSQTVGHYAWWIGDEGVKARANLSDPYHASTATADDNRTRLQSAQRPAIETMTSDGTDGLARLDPATQSDLPSFKAQLAKILASSQLAHLAPSAASFPDELKARHHDFSIHSRGVLSDTKNGGLKADLSYLFAQRNLTDFRTALNAAYGDNNVAPDNTHNRVFKPETTLYATFPTTDDSASYPYRDGTGIPGIFEYAPTWEQLWSFANMGNLASTTPAGVFDASGNTTPRRHTAGQHGLHPILIQFKLFYRLRIVGGSTVTDPDGTPVNRTGRIWSDVIPVVLIANPYAVPLAPADYQLHVSASDASVTFGTAKTDGSFDPGDFPHTTTKAAKANVTVIYNLRSSGMAAGEARIFTVDEDAAANPTVTEHGPYSLVPYVNANQRQFVAMKDELDQLTGLTYDTGLFIPDDKTHVALRGSQPAFNSKLYMDTVGATAFDDAHLLQLVRGQGTNTTENNSGGAYFILNPTSEGTRQGGGYYMLLNQPPIKEGAAPGYFANTWVPQQAPFLQVNYRGMFVFFGGSDTGTGGQNTVEWARTFAKNGSNGQAGDIPSPWLEANLIRRSGDYEKARWGLFNMGEGSALTEPPSYITDPDVGFQNLLYDIPRPGHPLATLGQLQHFNTTGFLDVANYSSPDNPARQSRVLHSWQSSYALSNSYPNPRVTRERLFDWHNKMGRQFDGSYLWNDLLWDRFHFSTYPQTEDFDFATDRLINARLRPFRDRGDVAWDNEENFRGDGEADNPANARIAAANLLVDGAFNINSTSVEAWKAVFSSLKNVPIAGQSSTVAPFSRTLVPISDSTDANKGNTPNSWNGFYDFSETDIQSLAEEMVLQIRRRGPFTSLAEFVNRRLATGRSSNAATAPDTLRLGLSGALQAALDAVINQRADLAAPFDMQAKTFVGLSNNQAEHNATRDPDFRLSSGLAGMPGYVLQGDVLSALGASLSARSDTFVIRTYGDNVNPATGDVTARAWIEAIVQRTPDYVDDSLSATDTPAAGSENDTFGRKYQIVSFRWLTSEEI